MYTRIWLGPLILLVSSAVGFSQSSAVPTCADLYLVPAVRECSAVVSSSLQSGVAVIASRNPEDQFAAEDLEAALKNVDVPVSANSHVSIRFERSETPEAKNLLRSSKMALDPAMHDEGYVIIPEGKGGLAVIADTSAGLFYGEQTVKQIIRGSGKEAVLLVPAARDWPAMPHRGISDDWSRGPIPSMDFLKREIRTLAAYKLNIFSPYFEHTFAYSSSSIAAFPGAAMTPAEGRELVEYAAKYHITILPEQESFGHVHKVLKFEQFSSLGETPHGSVLAPGDGGSLPLIGSWFTELAKVFPGPWVHIGADETFELGFGRTRDRVKQQGLGAVYLDFLKQIHTVLEPNHKQLLFWGDIAVNSPELVGTLPKDMIAVPWEYDAKPDFTPLILPFKNAGLQTWVAPGVNNWNRMYPNNNEALGNIRAFVRDGQKLGSTGMLNTIWNDDGEGLFDQNWFGVLFGGAAAWQPGESSEEAFTASFGQAFHRDSTGKISQAQRELMAAHNVLKKAGLGDAQDAYFWLDPFSPEGQRVAAKLRPVVAQFRLHAERSIVLTNEAKTAAKLDNLEALDALELGARRMDFFGFMFQTADECVSSYNHALDIASDKTRWGEVSEILWNISSSEGRFQDIRGGYATLGGLYRQAWMRDNRPYWLDYNLAHYQAATELWIYRGDKWNSVIRQWEDSHTLPFPSEIGIMGAATQQIQ